MQGGVWASCVGHRCTGTAAAFLLHAHMRPSWLALFSNNDHQCMNEHVTLFTAGVCLTQLTCKDSLLLSVKLSAIQGQWRCCCLFLCSFISKDSSPLLWASTYQAGEHLGSSGNGHEVCCTKIQSLFSGGSHCTAPGSAESCRLA